MLVIAMNYSLCCVQFFIVPMSDSVDKITDVTNEIDNSWVNLKKVLDKHPKEAIQFFHDKDGWQLSICATFL